MARRITRKQLKEDEFVSTVDTVFQWFSDNWRPFAVGLLAVCLAALAWWAIGNWTDARSGKASYALNLAMQAASGEDGIEKAEAELRDVVDRYGRTEQGDAARLYLARIHLDRGETDAARDLLLRVAERQRSGPLGQLATVSLLQLRSESGQAAEVAGELEAIVASPDPRLPKDLALYELGQLAVRMQQAESARAYFQQIVDEFPESPYRALAGQRLAELG
jgi:predicted negative regulator of RcsB-dependent stress response